MAKINKNIFNNPSTKNYSSNKNLKYKIDVQLSPPKDLTEEELTSFLHTTLNAIEQHFAWVEFEFAVSI